VTTGSAGSAPGPPSPARALDALYDSRAAGRPYVTYGFLALCLLVTLPTLLYPRLYDVFGGIEPRLHPWQLFTAAFEHGWPGFHGSVHLALNVFLILECGRPAERLLGHGRFLLLGALSLLANAAAQAFTEGVNGSSLVIWSWGPPLFLALAWAKGLDPGVARAVPAYGRIRAVLILMYGVIVAVMGVLPYAFGAHMNPLVALLRGNLYHLVATGVGVLFTLATSGSVKRRLRGLEAVGP
jgi:membrane associated rhomboid family serine protease